MFFVTNEPRLFNMETGVIVLSEPTGVRTNGADIYRVVMNERRLFKGTRKECDDFIFSLAGWVGAVNPITLERASDGN